VLQAFPRAPVIVAICDNDSIHHDRKVTAYLSEHYHLDALMFSAIRVGLGAARSIRARGRKILWSLLGQRAAASRCGSLDATYPNASGDWSGHWRLRRRDGASTAMAPVPGALGLPAVPAGKPAHRRAARVARTLRTRWWPRFFLAGVLLVTVGATPLSGAAETWVVGAGRDHLRHCVSGAFDDTR
jgi:hypothetical protein